MTHDPICPQRYGTRFNCRCSELALRDLRSAEWEKAAQRVAALPFWSDWQEFVTRRNAAIAAARGEAQ